VACFASSALSVSNLTKPPLDHNALGSACNEVESSDDEFVSEVAGGQQRLAEGGAPCDPPPKRYFRWRHPSRMAARLPPRRTVVNGLSPPRSARRTGSTLCARGAHAPWGAAWARREPRSIPGSPRTTHAIATGHSGDHRPGPRDATRSATSLPHIPPSGHSERSTRSARTTLSYRSPWLSCPTRRNSVDESQSETAHTHCGKVVVHLWQYRRVVANFDPQLLAESIVKGDQLPGSERVRHDIRYQLAGQQHRASTRLAGWLTVETVLDRASSVPCRARVTIELHVERRLTDHCGSSQYSFWYAAGVWSSLTGCTSQRGRANANDAESGRARRRVAATTARGQAPIMRRIGRR
jgi:hypothetical protein